MAVDGAPVEPEEVNALERVCILFDGNDDAAVQHAREQWKALTESRVFGAILVRGVWPVGERRPKREASRGFQERIDGK